MPPPMNVASVVWDFEIQFGMRNQGLLNPVYTNALDWQVVRVVGVGGAFPFIQTPWDKIS